MRRFIICLLLSIVIFEAGAQVAPPTKGVFVLPAIIDFNLAAGQTATKLVSVYNRTDKPMAFRVYFGDWRRDSLGRHIYLAPNSADHSCSRWTSTDKDFIEIPSGGMVPLNLTMRVPDSTDAVKDMRWAIMFVELAEEKKVQLDTGVNRALIQIFRLGVHVTQTPPHITRKEIKLLEFGRESSITDSLVYKIVTQNTGEVQVRCKGSLELTNLTTGEKTKIGPDSYPMYPGHRRILLFRIPANLPKGKYSALAIVDAGEDLPLEAAQSEIEIK